MCFYAKTVLIVILGVLFLLSSSAFAAGYLSGGIGAGGSAGDIGFTLEGGATEVEIGNRNYLIGGGIPIIAHGYDIEFDTDQPCPHGEECVGAGDGNEGSELGLYAKTGIESVYPGMYLSLLLGFTRVTEIEISRKDFSDDKSRYYKESSEKKKYALYGVAVRIILKKSLTNGSSLFSA